MRTSMLAVAVAVTATMTAGAQTPPPNPNQMFVRALTGLNSVNVSSLVYSGSGTVSMPASAGAPPTSAQPLAPVAKYTVAINYGMMSSRTEIERTTAPKKVTQFLSEGMTWNVTDGKAPVPMPRAVKGRERQIWMTPHGILKAAQDPGSKRQMANATGPDGTPVTTMAFVVAGWQMKATLNAAAMIERVEATREDLERMSGDPAGDSIEIVYGDYKDYDGIKFPTHIVQKQNGQTMLDIVVTEVRPNAGLYVEVPAKAQKAFRR